MNYRSSKGTFESVASAASKFNLKRSTVSMRLKRGWSIDEALGIVERITTASKGIEIEFDGEIFPSIAKLVEKYNKSRKQVYSRLKAGWTLEQALDLNPPPCKFRNPDGSARNSKFKKPLIVDGKYYLDTKTMEYKEGHHKFCRDCGSFLPISKFEISKRAKDGYGIRCSACAAARRDRWHNDLDFRNNELEKQLKYAKKKFASDPKYRERISEYQKKKYKEDPKFRLDANMSSYIRQTLNGKKAGQSWLNLVDFTVEELMEHIESQFEPGMTWDNYSEWHIDHRKPRSWFKYETAEDNAFKECWSLDNLQPKWAEENRRKSNKYED